MTDDKPHHGSTLESLFDETGERAELEKLTAAKITADKSAIGASIEEFMQGLDNYVELDPDAVNSETQLILNWGRKGFGFGMLSFFDRDGVFECDNECMSREFCNGVLEQYTATMSSGDLPPLLRRFQTIGALLDACTPTSPGPDWPAPKEKP